MRLLLLLMSLLTSLPAISIESDFDKVCSYFNMLESEPDQSVMTKKQRGDYISALVSKNLKPNSSARQLWEVVIYAVPDERYEIYKSTAEDLINSKWKCTAMKKYIPVTAE